MSSLSNVVVCTTCPREREFQTALNNVINKDHSAAMDELFVFSLLHWSASDEINLKTLGIGFTGYVCQFRLRN